MENTSLQNLNPIVLAEPVGWWPLAAPWYVVFIGLAMITFMLAHRRWKHWQADRYRREAWQELESAQTPAKINQVLKRAALVAFPRAQVAALDGDDWYRFLDRSAGLTVFAEAAGQVLDQAYTKGAATGPEQMQLLRGAARQWLGKHGHKHQQP